MRKSYSIYKLWCKYWNLCSFNFWLPISFHEVLKWRGSTKPPQTTTFCASALCDFNWQLCGHAMWYPNKIYVLFFPQTELSFGGIWSPLRFLFFAILIKKERKFCKKMTFSTLSFKKYPIYSIYVIFFGQNIFSYMSLTKKNSMSVFLLVCAKVIASTNYGVNTEIYAALISDCLSHFMKC